MKNKVKARGINISSVSEQLPFTPVLLTMNNKQNLILLDYLFYISTKPQFYHWNKTVYTHWGFCGGMLYLSWCPCGPLASWCIPMVPQGCLLVVFSWIALVPRVFLMWCLVPQSQLNHWIISSCAFLLLSIQHQWNSLLWSLFLV